MTYEIVLLIVLLILSGFFSSTELAFVVSNKIKIELRARQGKLAEKNLMYFLTNPQIFFSTILISNNIINISFASLLAYFISTIFQLNDFAILAISTVSLLLIGELLPKYFAMEIADSYVKFAAIPLRVISVIIYPFVRLTASVSNLLTASETINEESYGYLFGREDLRDLVNEGKSAGMFHEKESDIVNRVIELGEQRVNEAYTPRTDIVGVEINEPINDVINDFIKSGHSKLPVYEDNLDNIKGVVIAHDMFLKPKNISSVLRDVIFVPDSKKSLELLNEMLEKRVSISIVVDEFGGTAGMVTIEDIIEELFGEIRDEYDIEDEICRKIDDNSYIIKGKAEIDHLNEQFPELNLPEGDFETIAGYLTNELGRIPLSGEVIVLEPFILNILRADKRKINMIKLKLEENYFDT